MSGTTSILTVSALVALLQDVVESNFVAVEVEGELSNFSTPASGHWYFTLKDERAQLRAVMFRGRNQRVRVVPRDGVKVVCRGSVGIYPARGEVQFIVESMVAGDIGNLQKAFEQLKIKLAAEGLFAVERKRPLPAFPACVGVVTSETGAAIHDILNVVRRRAPGLRILLRPVKVQGEGAAEEIVAAIGALNRCPGVDVLIVGRGGGSLEDLWAFNEEKVARAIARSERPVISAVGHEVDVTIADLVADVRAATPSAAAELVAKSRLELETHLDHLTMRLETQLLQRFALVRQQLDGLQERLRQSITMLLRREEQVESLSRRLGAVIQAELRHQADRLGHSVGRLQALSPLSQLERGYVIASRPAETTPLTKAAELSVDEELMLRFSDGRVRARVTETDS